LELQISSLQREITSSLEDRDLAVKELAEMRAYYGDDPDSIR